MEATNPALAIGFVTLATAIGVAVFLMLRSLR